MLNRDGAKWSRDETILALDLYMRTPCGSIHFYERPVKELAEKMGRSPSSLAMKMVNLGRLDPSLSSRGVGGLAHGAKEEVAVWNEFSSRIDLLCEERTRILNELSSADGGFHEIQHEVDDTILKIPPGMEKERLQKVRVNQSYFRSLVLTSYGTKCCITGMNDKRLLIASHIKPWSDANIENERVSPANGLCLNALHDKAFDRGLITIDTDYHVVISKSLRETVTKQVFDEYFAKYDNWQIETPFHFKPAREFIEYHNEHIFLSA